MKPLEHPPEWEGDDSINAPPVLTPVSEDDLKDARVLDEKDDDEDDDDS